MISIYISDLNVSSYGNGFYCKPVILSRSAVNQFNIETIKEIGEILNLLPHKGRITARTLLGLISDEVKNPISLRKVNLLLAEYEMRLSSFYEKGLVSEKDSCLLAGIKYKSFVLQSILYTCAGVKTFPAAHPGNFDIELSFCEVRDYSSHLT